MKKVCTSAFYILIAFTVLLSCSKDENPTDQPDVKNKFTVYKNQTGDINADALQAQYTDLKGDLNLYGVFDSENNPTQIKTITYQKANNDTIVNLVIDQITNRLSLSYFSVKGVKSPVVLKFDYIDGVTNAYNLSYYNYNWDNATSELLYCTHVETNNGVAKSNPFFTNKSQNVHSNNLTFKEITASILIGITVVHVIPPVVSGLITAGPGLLAAAVAAPLLTAAAVDATILYLTPKANASDLDYTALNLPYPSKVPINNPVPDPVNPLPKLKPSSCSNTNITFTGAMDSLGNISFSNINGGNSPYSYLVNSGFQVSPIFTNNYKDGTYLLAVKDANGCLSTQSISLYDIVTIGTQVWMKNNLDVDHYRNGDPIPQVTDPAAWANLTTGAWCYYENSTANGTTYGKLYNWYAVNDTRGLAPTGYHVPTDTEWTTLNTFLGGVSVAGDKMKATTGWTAVSGITNTNSSGFTGLPGGYRYYNGTFSSIGSLGYWWSSSEYSAAFAWTRYLYYNLSGAYRYYDSKKDGFSVRCLRD